MEAKLLTPQHTQGPWKSQWEPDDGNMMIYVEDGRTICPLAYVAIGLTVEGDDGEDEPDTECQDYANARLIAAAPDLLAELQHVYDNLHRWTGTSGPGCADWTERTRAAIAKARGE